jgi:UDP-N-acetylmuramoylalanine--D-glutamate ligase
MIAGKTFMRKAYRREDFAGLDVAVVGLGASGVAACRALDKAGARVRATDAKSASEMAPALAGLEALGVRLELGANSPDFALGSALVVLSPGVPLANPVVDRARSAGVPVISEVELAYCLTDARVVAITGTNGKTTTTSLIGAILKTRSDRVHVCGNIGLPISSVAPGLGRDDILVAEISSFQLDTCISFRPEVGVLLNITPDHLNRYASYEDYVASKSRLFANQIPEDFAVINHDDEDSMRASEGAEAHRLYFSLKEKVTEGAFVHGGQVVVRTDRRERTVFNVDALKIKGPHNLANSLAAVLAASALGFDDDAVREGVAGFEGLEHRYEPVAEIDGVTYINDSKATNVDSVRVALEAVARPAILIAGGRDKGGDFEALRPLVEAKVSLLLAVGEARDTLRKVFSGITEVRAADTLESAVRTAGDEASPGTTVLLSPGCASFDMFADFEERGRVFKRAVRDLEKTQPGVEGT